MYRYSFPLLISAICTSIYVHARVCLVALSLNVTSNYLLYTFLQRVSRFRLAAQFSRCNLHKYRCAYVCMCVCCSQENSMPLPSKQLSNMSLAVYKPVAHEITLIIDRVVFDGAATRLMPALAFKPNCISLCAYTFPLITYLP